MGGVRRVDPSESGTSTHDAKVEHAVQYLLHGVSYCILSRGVRSLTSLKLSTHTQSPGCTPAAVKPLTSCLTYARSWLNDRDRDVSHGSMSNCNGVSVCG